MLDEIVLQANGQTHTVYQPVRPKTMDKSLWMIKKSNNN